MRLAALSLGFLLATSTAHAGQITDQPPQAATDDQLVLLNASSWIGSIDQIARIRLVLSARPGSPARPPPAAMACSSRTSTASRRT